MATLSESAILDRLTGVAPPVGDYDLRINLAVTGHSRHGKTTWVGNLLNLLSDDAGPLRPPGGFQGSVVPGRPSPTDFSGRVRAEELHGPSRAVRADRGSTIVAEWYARKATIGRTDVLFQVVDVPGSWYSEGSKRGFIDDLSRSVDVIAVIWSLAPKDDGSDAVPFFAGINERMADYPGWLRPAVLVVLTKADLCREVGADGRTESPIFDHFQPRGPRNDGVVDDRWVAASEMEGLVEHVRFPSLADANPVWRYIHADSHDWAREPGLDAVQKAHLLDRLRRMHPDVGAPGAFVNWPGGLLLAVTGSVAPPVAGAILPVPTHNTLLTLIQRARRDRDRVRSRRLCWTGR